MTSAAAAAAASARTTTENAAGTAAEHATGVQATRARQICAGGDQASRTVVIGPGATDRAHFLLAHTLKRGSTRRSFPNKNYSEEVCSLSLMSKP